jgi:hypothetical protein
MLGHPIYDGFNYLPTMPTLKTWKTNNGKDYLNVTTSSWASNYDQPIKK